MDMVIPLLTLTDAMTQEYTTDTVTTLFINEWQVIIIELKHRLHYCVAIIRYSYIYMPGIN